MAAASSADSEGTGNSSNAANYLLEMLKQFRLANPRSTSEEFILHIRDQLGRVNFANCYTAEGWRQLMRLESTVLLDFFASVHPDFRDYQLDMLLEQWHRLAVEAGSDWNPSILSQFVDNLNSYFVRHDNYKCRQEITEQDVLFLYRRFGIVPSRQRFRTAIKLMITCIEWVSVTFDMLFSRFSSLGPMLHANLCRLCFHNSSGLLLELTTVCPLTQQTVQHDMVLCAECSSFVRHRLLCCPCCFRRISKAKQRNL